jgi:hypothetical protein
MLRHVDFNVVGPNLTGRRSFRKPVREREAQRNDRRKLLEEQ